ncbi:MAG: class I SAM-dependent methyltransferase [Coriobacteriia bacterium]|nr:class I SAM-dependent methyltransferase [Coriobacteriia bacterium]
MDRRTGWRITNTLALVASVGWLFGRPGWEPLSSTLVLIATLFFQERRQSKYTAATDVFDYVYTSSDSQSFYDTVAPSYDARNSSLLLETHREVISRVRSHVQGLESWSVLDLGGGTGRLIADHFYEYANGMWSYVDESPGMVRQFQKNMASVALKTAARVEDIDSYLVSAERDQFDVVVLALVLSSMESDPDWMAVARVLKPGGELVVADIEPSYTATHPHYSVLVRGQTHALKTRSVHLAALIPAISAAGLQSQSTSSVKTGKATYSFVAVFGKPTIP